MDSCPCQRSERTERRAQDVYAGLFFSYRIQIVKALWCMSFVYKEMILIMRSLAFNLVLCDIQIKDLWLGSVVFWTLDSTISVSIQLFQFSVPIHLFYISVYLVHSFNSSDFLFFLIRCPDSSLSCSDSFFSIRIHWTDSLFWFTKLIHLFHCFNSSILFFWLSVLIQCSDSLDWFKQQRSAGCRFKSRYH